MKFITLLLAAWFMLAMPSAAHADPITGLIAAISSIWASLGVVGQFLVGLALKIGTSLLSKALQKDPEPVGVSGQIEVGGDNPISFIAGTYATAGQLEYVGTWGKAGKTPNAYLTQVISLSDLPVHAMSNIIWIGGERCTIDFDDTSYGDWGYPVKEFAQGDDNALWIKFYDGTQTVADPLLLAQFGSDAERPWKADMIGRGMAYAVVTSQYKREVLTGIPRPVFVLQGVPLYDPRKDSTVGGSGSHRWGQRSTYEWSDNPKVIQYNVMRGIYYDGEWVYGGQGMRAFQLPVSSWFAAMNECDRLITLKSGKQEKNFRCGFEIRGDIEPLDMCQKLDKACNGRTAENGGIYKTICGAPGLPVYYFTDESIIISEPQGYNPFPGLEKTYNGAHATYPEPDEAWAAKDAPPRYRADYEAQDDGRRLIADLTYEAVPYARQVQRLMRAALEANRRFRSHQAVFPPEAKLVESLDVISWTSARNGYINKRFQLGAMDDLNNVNQSAAFSELDPSDYDWSTDFEMPTSVGPLGPVRPEPQILTGFAVFPEEVKDAAGKSRRAAILLTWPFDNDDVGVRAIAFQVREAGKTAILYRDRSDQPEDQQCIIAPFSLLPNSPYQVRAKFIGGGKTEMFRWSAWMPVTTPDIKLGADDIDIERLIEELEEWIGADTDRLESDLLAIATELSDRYRGVIAEIRALRDLGAEQDFSNYTDRKTIETKLISEIGSTRAEFDERINVATSETGAIATRVTTLEVDNGALNAAVTEVQTAMVNADEALAQSITGVDARLSSAEGDILGTSSAVTAIEARVSTAEGKIETTSTAVTAVEVELSGKASDLAVTALEVQIADVNGRVTSQGMALTAVQGALTNFATSSALSSLSQKVDSVEGAWAEALTALNASTDGSGRSSTARFRMTVTDGSNGAGSRIALAARAGSSESWRAAAMYLDVPVNQSEPSTIALRADRVVIVANGSAGATAKSPFTFSGSKLTLQDLEVNGSLVVNGTIVTDKIGAGAVSDAVSSVNPAGTADLDNAWTWSGQLTVAHDNLTKVLLNQSFEFNVSGATSNANSGEAYGEFRILRGSTVIKTGTYHLASKVSGAAVGASLQSVAITHVDTPGSGPSTTYTFEVRVTGYNVNTNAKNRQQYALAMKR